MPVGQPFDDEAKRIFLSEVGEGKSVRTSAALAGFSWRTVKRHLESDLDFANELADAQEYASAGVEDVLYEEALAGNLGAIRMWLHNRSPDRWRDESVLRKEITGAGGGPITVVQANVAALREVLTDGDTRTGALSLVHALPAAGDAGPPLEDGDAGSRRANGHS